MTLRPSYLAGVLALGLALTACSSSGGGESTPPPTVPATQATTATTPVVPTPGPATTSASSSGTAPSHDALAAIVVQQGDVPTGYTGQAPDTSSDDAANQAQIVACVGAAPINPADRIEEVHSNDFVKDPQTVSSDVTSFKSQAAVDALVSVITNPKAQGCFDALLRQQVASSGGTVNSATVTITPGAASGGPSNAVALLQGTVNITVQGQQATVNVVEGFIQGRQLLATVSVEAIGTDVDADVFKTAGAAVANRAAAA